jgi:uncharacterized protein YbjQ (UPF0145 family)
MDILLSTTHVIDGRPVSGYLGIVTGAVRSGLRYSSNSSRTLAA